MMRETESVCVKMFLFFTQSSQNASSQVGIFSYSDCIWAGREHIDGACNNQTEDYHNKECNTSTESAYPTNS